MFRFLVVMALVYGAYTVGRHDVPTAPSQAFQARAAVMHRQAPRISDMRANDDGIASDVSAIVRDGMAEVGDAVGMGVRNASTDTHPDTAALARDFATMASRMARTVAGEIVIRVCPSLGLACAFPSNA